jgi:hypothetical protein
MKRARKPSCSVAAQTSAELGRAFGVVGENRTPRTKRGILKIAVKGLVVSNVPPPLLGFNNNVRHRGRIFHIQTEDSGVRSPRIVTHLFADGGRIIRTARTDYTEHLARPDLQAFVRALMKEQHKAMFMSLRLGELDAQLEEVCGPFEQALQRTKPPQPELTSSPPLPSASSETMLRTTRVSTPDFETPPLASAFGDEERISERPERLPALASPTLRRLTPAGMPRVVAPLPGLAPAAPSVQRPNLTAAAPAASAQPPGVSRPASRFAAAPSKSSSSIFGDGVISEQSLDEVILSYLAEDLDGSSE